MLPLQDSARPRLGSLQWSWLAVWRLLMGCGCLHGARGCLLRTIPRRGWRRCVLQVEARQWVAGAVSLTALEAKGAVREPG